MVRFSTSEAERFEAALAELYAIVPIDAYPARALGVIRGLIGYIHASYNEVDTTRSSHRVHLDPAEMFRSDLDEVFGRYFHQHPVISHVTRTGDSRSLLITDFISQKAFRRLELYNELYRLVDTEAQLSITLSTTNGELVAFALNRGRPGFSERDRATLDRIGAHLLVSYENAKRLSQALGRDGAEPETNASVVAVARLTDRQREILDLVCGGQTNAQIASNLGISTATAKKHLEHIAERLQVNGRTAAAALYVRATGFSGPDEPVA